MDQGDHKQHDDTMETQLIRMPQQAMFQHLPSPARTYTIERNTPVSGPQQAATVGAQKSANRLGPGSSFCSQVVHRRQAARQGGEIKQRTAPDTGNQRPKWEQRSDRCSRNPPRQPTCPHFAFRFIHSRLTFSAYISSSPSQVYPLNSNPPCPPPLPPQNPSPLPPQNPPPSQDPPLPPKTPPP